MKTLLLVLLLILGGSLLLLAPLPLLAGRSFAPAAIAIDTLLADPGRAPDSLHVTGGSLFWPAALESYDEKLRTGERTSNGFYVPLIATGDPESASESGRRILVHLPPGVVAERFAAHAAGNGEDATPFEPFGSRKPGRALPLHVKKGLAELQPDLDLDEVVFIEHGALTRPYEVSLGLAIPGLLLAGFALGRLRRRTKTPGAAHDGGCQVNHK